MNRDFKTLLRGTINALTKMSYVKKLLKIYRKQNKSCFNPSGFVHDLIENGPFFKNNPRNGKNDLCDLVTKAIQYL